MSFPSKQTVVEDIVSVFETTQNQSWSMFSDKLNNVSNKNTKKKDPAKSENKITLSSDDIHVFGLVPRLDEVMFVSCNECEMVVKKDCIHSHFYRRHNNSNVSHSEADKFSLVNFLCTVKTNKNKKLKMTVRKPDKKINEREKVNTVVKEVKTEFDEVEYERLLKTNRAKIKQENRTTEYGNHHDVDMAKTSCNPNTGSGVYDWDVKPCIKSLALEQCTDLKVNDKTIKHDKDSSKFLSVSFGNNEDLPSKKYLNIQNIEHTVNYVTSSSQLLKLDRIQKISPKLNIDFASFIDNGVVNIHKKNNIYKNKHKKSSHNLKKVKETKLIIKNEYSEIINSKNYKDNSNFYNQSSNTSAADVKIENYKLFSRKQNEHTKPSPNYRHLDVKSEMPISSATSYNQPTESQKIKEEFQNIPNNMYPNVKIKEEFQIIPNNMYPDVKIKDEFQNISNNMYPNVKIKEEYDENNDKCKVEFYQSSTESNKCSSDNNHSEVLSNTFSGNVDSYLSSIAPCSVVDIQEETTFMENSENITMNKKSSDENVISNNQSLIASINIKEESKYSLITDLINEVSKPSLITVCTNEESKPSLNIDCINEKSKYPLITNYITDSSKNKRFQLFLDSVSKLLPSHKYLDDDLNLQDENNLSKELNFPGEDYLNDELNLQNKDSLCNELNLLVKEDLNNELNLHVDRDLNDKINFQYEEDLIDEIDLQTEDNSNDGIDWHSVDNLFNELNSQAEEDVNVQLNLQSEDESSTEAEYQDEDDLSDELNLQNEDDLANGLNFQVEEDLNVELNLQSEDSLSDVENVSNEEEDLSSVEDMSDGEDLNYEENFSSKENLGSNVGTNDNLKYNSLISSQIPNNEEETKCIPSKECSVIVNNESSNVDFTDHDQSPTETLDNEEESKAKSKIDDAHVMIGNDGVVNNFENEHYQLYYNEVQTFTPNYKYSDIISNDSSDNSNESSSSYDESSVESLDVSDETNYSSTDTSSDYTSSESLCDSEFTCSTSSSDQSSIMVKITRKTEYPKINILKNHKRFMDSIATSAKSFDCVNDRNNCTQTNIPLECIICYDSSDDYIDCHSTQIDNNSAPNNSSNDKVDEYGVNNFTPISSSAQIINNKIIPVDVEEYELKDGNDGDFNISNKSHYSSNFHPHPCNPASKSNNLMHNPINENNFKIFNDEHNAYKPNEYITINEAIPFIDTNDEMCKELMKMSDEKSVYDSKCKIMPFVRIARNVKKSLKRRVADNKENRHCFITMGNKKRKFIFTDRD